MQATRPPSPATRRSTWRPCCFTFYDRDDIGGRLRHRALELSNERALDAYLAHMLLSQVDWSLRHQREPPTPRTTSAWPVWWDSTWRSPSGHDTRTRTTYSACLSQEILNALTPSRTADPADHPTLFSRAGPELPLGACRKGISPSGRNRPSPMEPRLLSLDPPRES